MKVIKLSKSSITTAEKNAVLDVLEKEYLGMGLKVKEFEVKLSDYLGRTALCVATGTAALQLAIESCGIGRGDEVICPSLTYVASFQAISASGATPIPCDVNLNDLTISIEDLLKLITPRTRAIMIVHYAGIAAQMGEILKIAKLNNLRVIEDAAHAFGSKYKGQLIGSFGDITCFSFDGIKNITSGEGGAVVTTNEETLNYVMDARLLGVSKDTENRYNGTRSWNFDVFNQGWRYHMSNIMAAIGIIQLDRLSLFITKRQKLVKRYIKKLNAAKGLELLNFNISDCAPHIFVIKVNKSKRDYIRQELLKQGIETGLHYQPNHLLSFFKNQTVERKLPNTEEVWEQLITLPLHYDLAYKDVDKVCSALIKILDES